MGDTDVADIRATADAVFLGGHLKPDSYYSIARLANEYGIDAAAEVADFEAANFEAVADFIRDEKVNCDFVITRAIDVQLSAEHQDRIQAGYRSLLAQGVKATKNTYCAPPEFAERVRYIDSNSVRFAI